MSIWFIMKLLELYLSLWMKSSTRRIAKRMITKVMREDKIENTTSTAMAISIAMETVPPLESMLKTEDAAPKRQRASAGEKSKLPILSHLIFLKRFKYGSQIDART